MSNMAYCRFENTLVDLEDCKEHLEDDSATMSRSEVSARHRLVEVCREIVKEVDDDL